ncbi:DNA mismatch repair protein MutS [Rhodopseudomonas sp. AAP120]|uniref:Smr/MutS family protein n=1 Tax=Rhodopseudomonas sp. AAP120 TaxID=1523430 RepID=UPI0006B95A26|nr:Smr/MutS family protein [Rhodopseudomonas sp. AAP120]KPF99659.1 DNA mismatch repair protein MutS [Rhodopseudomonas sp. AAP120]
MKRVIPPLDPPAPRRKRHLSEEERALWDSVAKQVKPLRGRPRLTRIELTAAPDAPVAKPPAPPPSQQPIKRPAKLAAPMSPPPLATLGRRERSHLSRGRTDIDARIDLHGMTQARAHHALLRFLQRASHDGLSFVLVITGKGGRLGGDPERGVLRRQVPHWLGLPEFRSYVVGFDEAALGHGGEGALYVRVRRARGS